MDNRVAGRRISTLRQAKGLTQQQLAAMMNVSHQAVSKWESGLALPDISTMLELTRFFGITVEQLFEEENNAEQEVAQESIENDGAGIQEEKESGREVKHINIHQLLQMAPFMSKAAVEEIAMGLEGPITASQLAKLGPFVSSEALQALIGKHKPQFSWESLKKVAPFMPRDAVDALARSIASGEEAVKPAGDNFNKTFNDIGKAFDSFGKDMGQALDDFGRKAKKGVKKAIRFGGKVINEVSSAINDFGEETAAEKPAPERSERALAIRKKAFERALLDGRWDWLAVHMAEIEDDSTLKSKIADRAKELGMHSWICENMGGYADEGTIKAAVADGNWEWLGENAWLFEQNTQQKVALAAMRAENWKWLADFSDQLELKECGMEIAQSALKAGEKMLAAQLARNQLTQSEAAVLAREACGMEDYEALELLYESAGQDYFNHLLTEFAEKGEWELVMRFVKSVQPQTIEQLMDIAVEQGDFDAIDRLDEIL